MMKNKRIFGKISLSMIFATGVLFVSDMCFAATGITAPTGTGLKESGTVVSVITKFISTLAAFIGGLSVLMIVVGGIMYITSGGESGKTETAKNMILYSVVGLIVALLAWVIVNAVIKAV